MMTKNNGKHSRNLTHKCGNNLYAIMTYTNTGMLEKIQDIFYCKECKVFVKVTQAELVTMVIP